MSMSPKEMGRAVLFWFSVIFLSLMIARLNSANQQLGAKPDFVSPLINAAPCVILVGFADFLMMRGTQKDTSPSVKAGTGVLMTGISYDLHRFETGLTSIVGGRQIACV